MAPVSGTLRTFGLGSINFLNPVITFQANRPAISATSQLLATEPVKVIPGPDTSWSVNLQSTDDLVTADVWYSVSVQWRDPAGNYMRADFPEWKLFVPAAGGSFADLVKQPLNPSMTIVSPVNPGDDYELKTAWLQMDPSDPNNPSNPGNTGDYYELENV